MTAQANEPVEQNTVTVDMKTMGYPLIREDAGEPKRPDWEFPCYEIDEAQLNTVTYSHVPTVTIPLADLVPADAVYTENDEGMAKRFLDIYRFKIKYCVEEKQWYIHDGICWKPDTANSILLLARNALYASYTKEIERLTAEDGHRHYEQIQKCHKLREKAGNITTITRCVNMAALLVPISITEFDADPYQLHAMNGSLYLKDFTGYAYHQPDLLFTKTAGTEIEIGDNRLPRPDDFPFGMPYCPAWTKFVRQCCTNNHKLQHYLQKAAGYSVLCGDISEQKVFCLLGEGRNGKSLFLNTLAKIAGDYACKIESSVLCTNRFGDKDNDMSKELYRIRGSRLLYSNEFGRTSTLNEGFIKAITDGGKISCRPLYGASIEYTPTYKLWFTTNHMPNLNAMDEGIRRRIVVIPFRNHLTEQDVDKHLADKFDAELPGILSWLIQGYMYYVKEGLAAPPAIQEATAAYFSEQDVFQAFVDEYYVVDTSGKVYAKNIYQDYRNWCDANGEKCVSNITLGKELQRLGIKKSRDTTGIFYTLILK